PEEPVVAVTVARMRLPEVPRFLRWGKPVERQVRDHPGTTLALAAFRPPRTIATFSVWRTVREMEEMVRGRSAPADRRHADAMAERRRRDFHHEFATYRFRPLAEHGTWGGPHRDRPGRLTPARQVRSDQAGVADPQRDGDAVVRLELEEEAGYRRLDGGDADEQPRRDLRVARTAGDLQGDVELTRCQDVQPGARGRPLRVVGRAGGRRR